MGERGRAVDTTGFSKANLVNSSTVSWSRSVDSINFAKIFETECKLSNVLPRES